MLNYTLLFLVIALVAAWLGFGMASGVAALAAKICFVAFIILFIASLVRGRGRTRWPASSLPVFLRGEWRRAAFGSTRHVLSARQENHPRHDRCSLAPVSGFAL